LTDTEKGLNERSLVGMEIIMTPINEAPLCFGEFTSVNLFGVEILLFFLQRADVIVAVVDVLLFVFLYHLYPDF